jgi:hypothetical protein
LFSEKQQAFDMLLKKSFKHLVRKDYGAWMIIDNHILLQNKKIVNANNSGADIKCLETPKSVLKCCLSNAEDGTQENILWDDSEQSDEGASFSENKSVTK